MFVMVMKWEISGFECFSEVMEEGETCELPSSDGSCTVVWFAWNCEIMVGLCCIF